MASIQENLQVWNGSYDWKAAGDEWSELWGSPYMQWVTTILPRIGRFLPAARVLEIAPGYGRWTHYLKDLCDKLVVVDLSAKCIEACKQRFQGVDKIEYHVNDGKSLAFAPDGSIDFVFSFDSLVHAEADVIEAYVKEISRILSADGVAFLHHSNLGEYRTYHSFVTRFVKAKHILARLGIIDPVHAGWRAKSMSAEKLRGFVEAAGLKCIGQEKLNWRTKRLIDCMSVITRPGSRFERSYQLVRNGGFMDAVDNSRRIAPVYGDAPG